MNDQQEDPKPQETAIVPKKAPVSSQVIAAESVQAEEVPTIPLDSLHTLNTLQPEVSVRALAKTQVGTVPEPLVVQPAEYRRGPGEWMRIWWDGIRPYYLWFAVLPLALGSVLAWLASISPKQPLGDFHIQRFAVALVAVCLLQIGANLLNDYYDYVGGVDTSNSLGPGGLIQQGLIKPARVLTLGLFALIVGAFSGALMAFYGGMPAFIFGGLGLLGAYFYSAPPRALSRLTLGEVVSFWLFGPLLTLGAYSIQRGKMDSLPLVCSISLGLLISATLYVNDMRDTESDAQARKYTLASLLSMRANRFVATLLFVGAYVPMIVLGIPAHGPHLLLITLWTLPGMVSILIALYRTTTPASLHITMHQALKMTIFFTILLIVAITITTYQTWLPHFGLYNPFNWII
ncbi:MAG TPA: 1,4-dihydroxy-2-naphthoate octaprenyltransferase [Ktedonobacteraceae bacterium]|nr:1,4-dihydroxy-2-naphthoate octaprenyltransferase [Ktedonobacteraceae bacterium]